MGIRVAVPIFPLLRSCRSAPSRFNPTGGPICRYRRSPPCSIAPGLSQRTLPGFSGTKDDSRLRTLDYSVTRVTRISSELKREVTERA